MNILLFISALFALIPAVLGAAISLESRQAGVWGKPTDIAVVYCYNDGDCIAGRELWQHCQVDLFEDSNAPIGNPEARNIVVASCLCVESYVDSVAGCLACLSFASENFLVRNTQTSSAEKVCNKTLALSEYENHSRQFADDLQFPFILPSLWLGDTNLTYPDQILIK
ncbi:hypothetical protein DID88_002240 [Monilinia fructigena]|uniref:Uncharacterized protein n=1 Tax=Monilinia fructigena TaxID=38457 RepID=A0A395ID43_9HELO|nr:hypothetical protein DID88_002240 [Monilinia fructigena]